MRKTFYYLHARIQHEFFSEIHIEIIKCIYFRSKTITECPLFYIFSAKELNVLNSVIKDYNIISLKKYRYINKTI